MILAQSETRKREPLESAGVEILTTSAEENVQQHAALKLILAVWKPHFNQPFNFAVKRVLFGSSIEEGLASKEELEYIEDGDDDGED